MSFGIRTEKVQPVSRWNDFTDRQAQAAARELYEACRAIAEYGPWQPSERSDPKWRRIVLQIHAALAKAEGR